MDVSKRNKAIAISRWKKKHAEERNKIKSDKETLLLKVSICAFLAGDGSVQKRREKSFYHYQIDFFPDDELMMSTYINQINKVYDINPTIRHHNNFYSVRFNSKVVLEDLSKLANFGLKSWTLPTSLFNIKGAKETWIKSFFSAEAYVGKRVIKVQTINQKAMKEVSTLLNEIGIDNNYYEYKSKKASESPVGIIMITKIDSRLRYYKTIGFWHNRKNLSLKESLGL